MGDHWRAYERMAAVIEAENAAAIDFSATLNASVVGVLSNTARQVDLLIDGRWDFDRSRRIIVDAKKYGRKLNVKDVETFEGMMRDCQADLGILVCPLGWSPAAERRAQASIALRLISLEQAYEETSWAMLGDCLGHCATDGTDSQHGFVLWDGQLPLAIDGKWAIVYTGRCDRCHDDHVWCWDCGEIVAVRLDRPAKCSCERQWWLLAENTEDGTREPSPLFMQLIMAENGHTYSLGHRVPPRSAIRLLE